MGKSIALVDKLEAGVATPAEQRLAAKEMRQAVPQTAAARRGERDRLLRRYHRRFAQDSPSSRAAAIRIRLEIERYRTGEWQAHQHAPACPVELLGTAKGLAWQVLKNINELPGIRQLQEILK